MAQESWKREQEAGCQQPDGPVRCANNCGFFGSAATMNMCSKCYRDHVLQQTKEAAKASAATSAKASQHSSLPNRVDPMDVDMESTSKARVSSDSDFMSGVHVLAGMAEEKGPVKTVGVSLASPALSKVPTLSTGPLSSSGSASAASPSAEVEASAAAATALPAPVSHPSRCAACKKKVGLTGFKCRCNNVFCSTHRYSDKHNCTFDYKAAARDAIAKANPVVRGSKIDKI